ncbi:MAG TPA: aminodeoxychorismate/anthranilate synthase component II, partial [Flavobacterium sp.]|nr:aminodeoxychorismate/anthranilate synthase component II [Flavobacterium sp.]
MMKIAVIDNYDSFTYNLVHYLEELGGEITVFRNDAFDLEELASFDKILLSPGPGSPDEAGLLKAVIQHYHKDKDILGICLGQQAIAEVFGGRLANLNKVFHGIASAVKTTVEGELLFKNVPEEFEAGRYHSWVVSGDGFPDVLEVTSLDENGQIMSLRHREFKVRGVQFHPESILTPCGKTILKN